MTSADRIPLLHPGSPGTGADRREREHASLAPWPRRAAALVGGALVGLAAMASLGLAFSAAPRAAPMGDAPREALGVKHDARSVAALGEIRAGTCAPVKDFSRSRCAHVLSNRPSDVDPNETVEEYAACMHGQDGYPKDEPYVISEGRKSYKNTSVVSREGDAMAGKAYVYSFVHIPKSAGSLVNVRLMFLAQQSDACVRQEDEPATWAGSYVLGEKHPKYPGRCVMDTSTSAFLNAVDALAFKRTRAWHQKFQEDNNRRTWIKGQFSMGTCDLVDAPCAYITALREPVDRMLSHYKYICLQGAEHHEGWRREWVGMKACPLDPVEFWTEGMASRWGEFNKQGHPEQMVAQLAPGADPASECALEAAKSNLVAPCMRYMLTDRMEDGMERLMRANDDFVPREDKLGESTYKTAIGRWTGTAARNAAKELPADLQARYDGYLKDEGMMRRLRALVPQSQKLYQFAKERYESQWQKPLEAC